MIQAAKSLFDPVRTITSTIAVELGETPFHTTHFYSLFALGLVLFAIALGTNLLEEDTLVGSVLVDEVEAIGALGHAADARTHGVTLDLPGAVRRDLDTHERPRRQAGGE